MKDDTQFAKSRELPDEASTVNFQTLLENWVRLLPKSKRFTRGCRCWAGSRDSDRQGGAPPGTNSIYYRTACLSEGGGRALWLAATHAGQVHRRREADGLHSDQHLPSLAQPRITAKPYKKTNTGNPGDPKTDFTILWGRF